VWKPRSWVQLIILFLQICNFLFLPISNKIIFSLDIVDLSCNNLKFYTINTTRKSAKTNGITDGYNSVSKSIGIYRQIPSVSDTVDIYRRICRYIPTVSPTDYTVFLKSYNGVMTWIFFRRFYRRNDRGIQTGISVQWCNTFTGGITDGTCPSVIPSVKVNIYPLCRHSLPLFLLLLPHPTSPLPNCSQPPIPTLPSSQHKHSSFLYFCTWSQHPFLWILSFFVSKFILFI